MSVLILYAHPAPHRSRVNRHLIEAVRSLPNVKIQDLYEAYPDFQIDVKHEQRLLLEHDTLVFQHPFYWYSVPALLKQWMDLVLLHGWAYGKGGTALRGKRGLIVTTTGGPDEAYAPGGAANYTMAQFLAPMDQTLRLCGIERLPSFFVHGTHRLDPDGIDARALEYRNRIAGLALSPVEPARGDLQ
jgi:glutathione-regulated potassium-efflux system ancillary protein KefG